MGILDKLFGSDERQLKKLQPLVDQINDMGADVTQLSDDAIKERMTALRTQHAGGTPLDDVLPEVFALVREAADRVIGERHYDVQLLGGIVLHQGKIAEMKTGEGKTLTSTLPIVLNALTGKGVHVVTVNDYLAKRDCNWMGSIYDFLGLSVACITHEGGFRYTPTTIDTNEVNIEYENLVAIDKKDAYAADITYGTNNEFGFDYLRDNMAQSLERMVQRVPHFAIVDEVDSILIDEARTPLIISAPDAESTKLYGTFASIIPSLQRDEDFTVDEKLRAVSLTDAGIAKVEERLNVGNLYEAGKTQYVHHLEQSLKAHVLFQRDKDYLVKDGQVFIIDDFTGRVLEGRRYSDGLHQAIEAKEGVTVQKESRTLATITFQNYFRMYEKLAGMTGTASTSAEELQKVYELDVITIPTHRTLTRQDLPDVVYKTERGKFAAIVEKIGELNAAGQPVLVGTVAVEKSEALSSLLTKAKISHAVLNAKFHEKEAEIVANAGQKGAVTIATNMAGRGTDIKLGEDVKALGGLYIIGTERHDARRIDNQLRGRSGRQGDPGTTQFYISLDDELMRRFGGDRLKNLMERLGLPEDQPIENKLISRQIEGAQSKIEGFNFDVRKHVLDYDNVVNKQREVVYKRRRELMEKPEVREDIMAFLQEDIEQVVAAHTVGESFQWELDAIFTEVKSLFPVAAGTKARFQELVDDRSIEDSDKIAKMVEILVVQGQATYATKEAQYGAATLRTVEKTIALQTIDQHWMNHLDEIEHLRQGIGLRGYGQRDPLIEYKKEAFGIFSDMMARMRGSILTTLFRLESVQTPEQTPVRERQDLQFQGASSAPGSPQSTKDQQSPQQPAKKSKKDNIGRNDPCYCGSGKKYKKCCGK